MALVAGERFFCAKARIFVGEGLVFGFQGQVHIKLSSGPRVSPLMNAGLEARGPMNHSPSTILLMMPFWISLLPP